jgi:hypothetical protein
MRSGYGFVFDIVDEYGRHFTGSYAGALGNGGTNP